MNICRRTVIDIKRHPDLFKSTLDEEMIFIYYLIRRHTSVSCFDRNRSTIFIRSTYIQHIFTHQPQKSNIRISRQIGSCQMPQMQGTIGIRQRRGYHISFWKNYFFHLSQNLNKYRVFIRNKNNMSHLRSEERRVGKQGTSNRGKRPEEQKGNRETNYIR